MPVLKLASCMAENAEAFCQNVALYIHNRLGIETGYVNDMPWQERERLFNAGEIQILWVCGLDAQGAARQILAGANLNCFMEAQDHDYDPIRVMARRAE